MANSNNKTITLYLALMLSLLLTFSISQGRLFRTGFGGSTSGVLTCDSVYGVKSGDTCFGVTQMFDLTTEFFDSINPNLNCTALFVGQWLCTDGSFE